MSEMTNLHQPACVDSQRVSYSGRPMGVGEKQPKVCTPDKASQASRFWPVNGQTALSRAGGPTVLGGQLPLPRVSKLGKHSRLSCPACQALSNASML